VVQVVAAEGRVMFLHQTHLHQLTIQDLAHLLIHNQSNHNPHIFRHNHRHNHQRTLHMSLRKNTGILAVAMELVVIAILGHVVTVVLAAVMPGPEMLVALLDQLKFSWPTEH
jgi:hypothetical protein